MSIETAGRTRSGVRAGLRSVWRRCRRPVSAATACFMCLCLSGCAVFEALEEIIAMVVQGIIILLQSLAPFLLQLAPLFVQADPARAPEIYRIDPSADPRQATRAMLAYIEAHQAELVAGEVRAVSSDDLVRDAGRMVREAQSPGLRTAAVILPCGDDAALAESVARLNASLARNGLRLKLYRDGERTVAVLARERRRETVR